MTISPQIDNGQVVWGCFDGTDQEIFFWNGENTRQLTDNNIRDELPDIHNGEIVWMSFDGDYEISYWDGIAVKQITDNELRDVDPQIHNGQIVWSRQVGPNISDKEIFIFDTNPVPSVSYIAIVIILFSVSLIIRKRPGSH